MPDRRKALRLLLVILKILVSVGLLYVVISKAGIDKVSTMLQGISIFYFLTACLMYIISIYLSSIRWQFFLPEGFRIKKLFSLYFIGSFFNNILPGIIGGDAVKAYYLNHEIRRTRATAEDEAVGMMKEGESPQNASCITQPSNDSSRNTSHSSLGVAVASVFMDRYIGFVALMAIGLIAYPFGLRYFRGSYIEWLMPLVVILFVTMSILLFGLRIGKRITFLSELYHYFASYKGERSILAKTFFISLIVQISGICAVYVISLGLRIEIPLLPLFIFIPIISTLTTIPLSISGIGVREASFVILFGCLGISSVQATAISFGWFLSVVAGSLPGLFEYLRHKTR
jgi:uncharacterized membrane protein YbhN (UPF0104 family)